MASDGGQDSEGGGRDAALHEPRECMACRGTGEVISNLGGSPSKITCPWCEGRGMRVPGIDAQGRWQAGEPQDTPPAPASEPTT